MSFNGQGIVSIKAAISAPTTANCQLGRTIKPTIKHATKQAIEPSKDLPAYILCLPYALPKSAAHASPKARYKKLAKTKVFSGNKRIAKNAPERVQGRPLIL